jgi:deazaflavin-dependent oxidoreductase (nitroreductase family)
VSERRRLHPLARWLLRLPVHLYDWNAGWLLGQRFVLVVHTGRRTGLTRKTVLEVVHHDTSTGSVVVMSGLGRGSDWYQNIQTREATQVTVGRRSFAPIHRDLSTNEAVAVLADYQQRNRVAAPVVRWVLSRLVGWRYDGTDQSRRRLVQQRPLVRFSRPATATTTRNRSPSTSTELSKRCWRLGVTKAITESDFDTAATVDSSHTDADLNAGETGRLLQQSPSGCG